ncbi:Oxoglutarate/iron-dependent oxygenase, C-terminal degradation domain-containing protein, partial [Ochromonadaceae sp. CCMP2298]
VRRFRAGLDYTVAHYGVLTKVARLDATLCFVNDDKEFSDGVLGMGEGVKGGKGVEKGVKGDEEDDDDDDEEEEQMEEDYEDAWDGGEVGGFECYIEAEEDPENAEAAEVYRPEKDKGAEDAETSLLSVSPCNNTLNLVLRDEGVMKFIKYVSANAPGGRWDVTAEFELDISDSSDEEEGDDEDEDEDSDEEEEEEEES